MLVLTDESKNTKTVWRTKEKNKVLLLDQKPITQVIMMKNKWKSLELCSMTIAARAAFFMKTTNINVSFS